MKVNVGSMNSLKVKAVQEAFSAAFPNHAIRVIAVKVASGVPPQPFADQVPIGAINRARKAVLDAHYGVGIEAGIVSFGGCAQVFSIQFCAIVDQEGTLSIGHGPGYVIPNNVLASLKEGSDLNQEMSRISGIHNISDKIGAIGYLSNGITNRLEITREAVLMALIPRLKQTK
jgi:inosine/xanthosine triphosphatase